jgi:hypothetical protein
VGRVWSRHWDLVRRSIKSLGIMRRLGVGLCATACVLSVGCTVVPARASCPSDQLTDERVRDISIAEFRSRGGIYRETYWNYRVTRANCRVHFYAEHKDRSPGLHFGVDLDDNGRVVQYSPGA